MLFNSLTFIYGFLPIVLLVFYAVGRRSDRFALIWLTLASLCFYGYWKPEYLALIMGSMVFNYWLGGILQSTRPEKRTLTFGVAINLVTLAYFKYANFFVENFNSLTSSQFTLSKIVLPLAISFFTFQQIGYLIAVYRGQIRDRSFLAYALFVCFFPQLIAGPIVHFTQVHEQFKRPSFARFEWSRLAIGFTLFSVGLFKKVVIADSIAPSVGTAFDMAATGGHQFTSLVAWSGALAYTAQLYFDFSGYSDMAIGLARLFGIKLPVNFWSPYRSTSISEFWRRWHITLSHFLRDYLYIPFGGNRKGDFRRHLNLMMTMLLGGLWHGASWNFVVWGGLHGLYLVINHVWRSVRRKIPIPETAFETLLAWTITFLGVIIGWVYFRAPDLNSATAFVSQMLSAEELIEGLTKWTWSERIGPFSHGWQLLLVLGSLIYASIASNVYELMGKYTPAVMNAVKRSDRRIPKLGWQPTPICCLLTSVYLLWALIHLDRVSEFLYFQF